MPSHVALRVFRVGNLLVCIFESTLRAVKKNLSSLLNSISHERAQKKLNTEREIPYL